jgi:hypothetical protein
MLLNSMPSVLIQLLSALDIGGLIVSNDTSTTTERDSETPNPVWGFVIGILGAVTVFLSVRYLHKPWNAGELVYDIGIAAITVAVLEILLLGSIRRLALRKTELDKFMLNLEKSSREFQERAREIGQQVNDIKLDNTQSTVHLIEQVVLTTQRELNKLQIKFDDLARRRP